MGLLDGLRVVDLSRVLSGPYCTALLADLGAEVIKIESPGGDDARHFGPFLDGGSVYFSMINRNKKSLVLNLRDPRAQAIVAELAGKADVVVENFRPGVAARLRVDYQTLQAANPRLVYLSISGFGQAGASRGLPAYDLIIQAMSGLMSVTGDPKGPPTAVGESIADLWTGLFGSWAVLAALQARERTGRGESIDLAMFDAMLAMQVTGLSQLRATGAAPLRVGNRHPVTTPVDVFATADGHLAIVAATDEHFRRLCTALDLPQAATDARFATGAARREHRDALRAILAQALAARPTAATASLLQQHDIPAGPVQDLQQAMQGARAGGHDPLQRVDHPVFGHLDLVCQPARFGGPAPAAPRRDPLLGEHRDDVLGGILGLAADDIRALVEAGVTQ